MRYLFVPYLTCTALAAIFAAGLSHWWSVREFVSASTTSLEPYQIDPLRDTAEKLIAISSSPAESPAQATAVAPVAESAREEFYASLLLKMNQLQNQNRDLLDQVAETNRDLMKLEFRVDTHSESFRPMPVTEELQSTSLEEDVGVLPPRAQPVLLPADE